MLGLFYCYIANGFANAVVKTVKSIDELNGNWDSLNVNPADSIKKELIFMIDSTSTQE